MTARVADDGKGRQKRRNGERDGRSECGDGGITGRAVSLGLGTYEG